MKYIINDQVVLSRPLEGPLAAYIGSFGRWAVEQGYGLSSLRRQVRLAACFSRWLGQKGVRLHAVSSEHGLQYLRYRSRRVQIHKGDSAALRYLIEFLNRVGVTPATKPATSRPNPVEECAQEFERYLREERVLARATIINYMPLIGRFLKDRFGDGPVRLSRLRAGDVVGFVQHQAPRSGVSEHAPCSGIQVVLPISPRRWPLPGRNNLGMFNLHTGHNDWVTCGYLHVIAVRQIYAPRSHRQVCCHSSRRERDPICTRMMRSKAYCEPR